MEMLGYIAVHLNAHPHHMILLGIFSKILSDIY
jgi:hypothetical protein